MRLSWSHNPSHEFARLTRVDSSYFLSIFLIEYFVLNFIFQQRVDLKFKFIISFDLCFMMLS
jgi:hypothetical protein